MPLSFPPFQLADEIDLLYREAQIVPLEQRAVQVLRYLVNQAGRVVSKEELLEAVWPDTFTTEDVLKKAVSQARRALGDDSAAPRYIRTWHGRGYQFIGTLTNTPANESLDAHSLDAHSNDAHSNDADAARATSPAPFTSAEQNRSRKAPASAPARLSDPNYDQLCGRATEWEILCTAYRQALEGTGQPVLLIGEPGIGKTQLARHFAEWVKTQGGQTLYGRFFDYDGNRLAPYETFLDLLRAACGIAPHELRNERERLAQALRERLQIRLPAALLTPEAFSTAVSPLNLVTPDEEFPRTLPLTVLDSTLQSELTTPLGDAFQAIVPLSQAFLQLSAEQPLLLVLDDVQWADEASRELLGWLMRNTGTAPLMLVLLARDEDANTADQQWQHWLKRQAAYRSFTSLRLAPLSETAFHQTIETAFPGLKVPAAQVRVLRQVTGGNPYFLTEMLRLLVAEKVITRNNEHASGSWQWQPTDTLHLPANLTLAAAAKLDRLSPAVREIAEQAAVIGDEFRLETLALMTGRAEDELEFLLTEAVRRGVLSEHGVSAGEHFRFYHSILRRVLYERLAPRARGKAHLRAAAAIETVYVHESDRVAEAISAHYEQGSDWQRAYDWSLRAWQATRQRWQWQNAATALERAARAAKILEQRDTTAIPLSDKLRLQLGLGESYASLGRFHEAATHLQETIAQATDHLPIAAAAHRELCRTWFELSRYPESIAHAQEAQTLYRASGDAQGEMLTLLALCRTHAALGNFADVEQLSRAVFALAAKHVALAAEMRGILGWTLALQSRYTEAEPLLNDALQHAQRTGNLCLQASLARRLHWIHLSRGNYETSFHLAERARNEFRSVGDASGEAKLNMALGQVRLAQGLFAEGLDYLQRTLQNLQEIGDRHCEAETYWLMGRAYCEQGEGDQARTLLTRALAMVRELGDRDDEFRVLTDLARVALAAQDAPGAMEHIQHAGQISNELGNQEGYGLVQVEAAFALFQLGQPQAAIAHAHKAIELLTASGSGERWRAHYALGVAAQEIEPPQAVVALRAAVAALKNIHDQVSPDQVERRKLIAQARTAPAALLAKLG